MDPNCLDGMAHIRRAFRLAISLRVAWLHPDNRYALGYEGYGMTVYTGQADESFREDRFKIFPPIVRDDKEVVEAVYHRNRHQCSTCYTEKR